MRPARRWTSGCDVWIDPLTRCLLFPAWLDPRRSIGIQLTTSLDTLIQSGHINPLLAIKVLNQFDRTLADTLNSKVKAKATVKGHLRDYNSCDEVWTFNVKNGTMKLDNGENIDIDKIRIVSDLFVPVARCGAWWRWDQSKLCSAPRITFYYSHCQTSMASI